MKFFIKVTIILVAGYILELFLPWWSIGIAAFFGGALLRTKANFMAGFLGIGLLWSCKAWLVDISAESDLPARVALIFPLHNTLWLFVFTGFLGGLIGGFAAMTGALIRSKKRSF